MPMLYRRTGGEIINYYMETMLTIQSDRASWTPFTRIIQEVKK